MKGFGLGSVALLFFSFPAQASNLTLSVETPTSVQEFGRNRVVVPPGAIFRYSVFAELTDAKSEGLAMFCFDMRFEGGALGQAVPPHGPLMMHFVEPMGLNNPQGFGGAQIAGELIQVGGAQNTINSTFAPRPTGPVVTGLALPGARQELVKGPLTAPMTPGTYLLELFNPMANVIREGETGVPFWRVDPARPGAIRQLIVDVQSLMPSVGTLSVGNGGTQVLRIDAGVANAGKPYRVLGSYSGTSPGTVHMGATVPLARDGYFRFVARKPNSRILEGSEGVLDSKGRATAKFHLPASSLDASWVGRRIHHAFIVTSGTAVEHVSNPVSVQLVQ